MNNNNNNNNKQQDTHQNGDQIPVILLFIQDQVMVYGYETNNGLKIVID